MLLHKCYYQNSPLYTLFDSEERVVHHPTRYLERLRRNKRPVESQRQIANIIKLHCEWLEKSPFFQGLLVDETLSLVAGDDILEWINDQREAEISENTIHNREVLVREMYKWLTTEEASVRRDTPWFNHNYTKQPHSRLPRFLTAEQVIKLLLGMHNESQRAAAHFMFDTGVRISELIRLTRQHLPDESHYPDWFNYYPLRVPGSKPFDGGNYKMRDTIISRPMLARIRRYHSTPEYRLAKDWDVYDPDKPIFLNVNGEALSKHSIYDGVKTAWKRQGENPSEIYPHRLRHGTAYSVLKSELGKELLDNLLILKGMLGHESIKTTEIYSSIPIVVLQSLTACQEVKFRYEEADEIYRVTYLAAYKNTQKRGRRKCQPISDV